MHRLIFGCGYLGQRVARLWRDAGDTVHAVTRSEGNARQFNEEGFNTLIADVTEAATLRNLPDARTLLFAVGYDRTAGPSIHEVYARGFQNVLDALPESVERIIYISTTGVYGGAGGAWVDEQTPPDPQRDGGKASLAAEEALRESRGVPARGAQARGAPRQGVALRLAGIYGPGRVPLLDKLRAGDPIAAPSEGHLNLIHVDDAAAMVVAAAAADRPVPPVLCVSDGDPPLRRDYYAEAARLIAAPPPQFVAPEPGSPRAARAGADKRVRNDLMRQTLEIDLKYANYRQGLAAILHNDAGNG